MGSKIDGPSGPRPRFFIVWLSHFQRGIGHYTWLACKTDISEEVRCHQSNVISRLLVVPGPPTDQFWTTSSIAFKLHPINETFTNRAAPNWFRAPKRFRILTHNGHPMYCPYGRANVCLCWGVMTLNINQIMKSLMMPHVSPRWMSHGVSLVMILVNIDYVMATPQFIFQQHM